MTVNKKEFISKKEFLRRRKELMAQLEPNSIAIVAAASVSLRNGDAEYLYRQNSDFYYLTGLAEPDSILVLAPGREHGEHLLFCQEKDPEKELWNGKICGPEQAKIKLNMDDAFPITDVDEIIPGLIEGRERVYFAMGKDSLFDQQVMDWVKVLRSKVRSGVHPPGEFMVLDHLLHEMRLFKSAAEIKIMQEAAAISVLGHKRAMQICRPGMKEYQLEAELLHQFTSAGSRAPAYNSIVAGGANACILHYVENDAELKEGDLVLIDAGCELGHYAADITRTFPVSGYFSSEQKVLYEIVLESQLKAINAVKPGNHWDDPHKITVQVITQGLVDLGLLKGEVKELIETNAYKDFYMHRAGHWIGMDVHDVGDYKIDDKWRLLEPGMVTTVEPGIYVAANNTKVAKKWRGIGIRIEDDILVTKTGHKELSSGLPKRVDDIEAFMAAAQ